MRRHCVLIVLIFTVLVNELNAQINQHGIYILRDSLRHSHQISAPTEDGIISCLNLFQLGEQFCNKMVKYDWQGNLEWYKKTCEIDSIRVSTAFVITELSNDNFLLSMSNGFNNRQFVPISEMSVNGEFVDVVVLEVGENEYLQINKTIELSSSYVLLGSIATDNSLFTAKPIIFTVDKNLELISEKRFSFLPDHAKFNDVIVDYDGNLLITGILYRDAPELAEQVVMIGDNVYWYKLFKYDVENNDTLWTKTNVFAPEPDTPYDYMVKDNYLDKYNNGYLSLSQILIPNPHNNFGWELDYDTWQLTFSNQNFEQQWSVQIQDSFRYNLQRPLILEDGSIILAGTGFGLCTPPIGERGFMRSLYFSKISSEGEVLWERSYPFIPNGGVNERNVFMFYGAGLHKHPLGGYLLFGSVRTNNNLDETGRDVLWAWIDEEGCIQNDLCAEPIQWLIPPEPNDPNLEGYTTNIISLVPYHDFKISPNPTTEVLNIAFDNRHSVETVEIYNNLGQLQYTDNEIQGNLSIDVSNWSTGLYIVNTKQSGRIFGKKVLKK